MLKESLRLSESLPVGLLRNSLNDTSLTFSYCMIKSNDRII